ncbi:MAG: glutamine synthetase [Candidatus Nitrosocaldaceae archaeon]|nr:MAG: glutamine synthetase [Candidatus Nitrosocaldaceae archaeon]GIU72218.1 MAG: glutamine synthetase [Candidatus Nitrosocaldaceae archaeon]GIU72873.1 MAG: glutamine synthetase [Candidatus Nitrosocaldaceae archaeon]
MNSQELLEQVSKDDVRFVTLQFSDLLGVVKEIIIPVEQLDTALKSGIWFDGSSIEGFARIQESDLYLKPDPDTYSVLPWLSSGTKTARLLCDIYRPDGKPFEGDPRLALKRVVEEAKQLGFEYNVGPEPEFYLFKDNIIPIDQVSYFDLSSPNNFSVIKDIVTVLKSFGIYVEAAHHEVGSGQYEVDFGYAPALTTADRLVTLKYTIKKIAQLHEMHATFMAKPLMNKPGSGLHVHQSLFKDDENVFYDPKDSYGLSKLAYNFIAGQMKHIKALCAVLCPTVNSYKRLVIGYEAPVYVTWASMNRSALIRVPRWFAQKPKSARIELRCPDPTCNPYLAFAVMLKAGLDGIKNNLEPPEPVEENVYQLDELSLVKKNIDTLPSSLYEALNAMEKDSIIKEALGDYLFDRYISIKRREWDEFKVQVTEWEIKKYLDTY